MIALVSRIVATLTRAYRYVPESWHYVLVIKLNPRAIVETFASGVECLLGFAHSQETVVVATVEGAAVAKNSMQVVEVPAFTRECFGIL